MGNENVKVMICDDTLETGIILASRLRELGMYAYTRRAEESYILSSVSKDMPDVVVCELSSRNMDCFSLIKKVSSKGGCSPKFIITSEINNSFIEKQVIAAGASYFLVKPFDGDRLCSVIKSLVVNESSDSQDLEVAVTNLIQRLGVPAHVKGYHYLRTAIIDAVDDNSLMDCITKQLYPTVARQHNTTSSRVERAIRHAIEIAWDRTETEKLNSFFGYPSELYRYRPTNSEFIALVSDKLRLQMKASAVRL